MSINIELFTTVIQENVFPNNSFLKRATDHSQYVTYLGGNGKTVGAAVVHVPQAGALPTVTKNRSSFPATGVQRTDSDLTYSIDEYSVAPFMLEYSEALTVAYDKAASLMYAMTNTLKQTIGNNTLFKWAPSALTDANGVTRILKTSGPTGTTLSTYATGVRKTLSLNDIAYAKNVLDQDYAPDSERTLVIPSAMWNNDILTTSNLQKYLELGSTSGLREGTIDPSTIEGYVGKIYGFDVYTRPQVVVYNVSTGGTYSLPTLTDAGVPSTTGTTDCLSAIFFAKNGVSNAEGQTVIFYEAVRADYYGALFSCLVRHGASKMRADGKFIGAIAQTA